MLWLHAVIPAAVLLFAVGDSADVDPSAVINSLGEANNLLKSAGNFSIVNRVAKYHFAAVFFATAVMETIKFINTFRPSAQESAELKYIKEQFAIVNNKLDALDHEFSEVKSKIDWNVMKVNMINYEGKINALRDVFDNYVKAPLSAKKAFESVYITQYETVFNDADLKIYHAMVSTGSIFQENIFEVARRYSKNDLKFLVNFTAYLMRLLQKGMSLNVAYLQMKGRTDRINEKKAQWKKRFSELQKIATKVDSDVKKAVDAQYRTDVDAFVLRNPSLSNADMANRVHALVATKFPWRQWFVLVYTFTNNNDKDRYFDNCGGYQKVNIGNKVVIVNNVPASKKSPRINLSAFHSVIKIFYMDWPPYEKIAKRLYEKITSSCKYYTFRGVFEEKAAVTVKAPAGRYSQRSTRVNRVFHNSFKPYVLGIFD